jgi:transposase
VIALAPQVRVFLHRLPTDMRKSFHGLVALVESAMGQDPLSGSLFVFFNARRDRVKILYWGQVGYCIWYQQLQQGTFQLPDKEAGDERAALELARSQLSLILDGIDLSSARQRPRFQLAR